MSRPDPREEPQIPDFPAFSLPSRRSSAWVVETDPDDARAWLETLSQVDGIEAAQQIYRGLYTLNRMALTVPDRLALMELYRQPVAHVMSRLQSHFTRLSLPLKPRFKQLADFLLQLQIEMAYGYKHVLEALRAEDRPWESDVFNFSIERSIRSLGQGLLRAYQVYMPTPPGVWIEIHSLYRYAEHHQCHQLPLIREEAEGKTIEQAYLQVLMLGLCGPYQLPLNDCLRVDAFLSRWASRAAIRERLEGVEPVGHFLVDLDADHPATPFPRDVTLHSAPHLRAVNAIELARLTHDLLTRLRQGESPRRLELGFECIGTSCGETLRRMLRFWGLAARRQFMRRRTRQSLSLCVGMNAIHFFSSGQQSFRPRVSRDAPADHEARLPGPRELDSESRSAVVVSASPGEYFRVDSRWQVRDESAAGLSLTRQGEGGLSLRIGDLLGIPEPGFRCWRIGVVRWIKSRNSQHVEAGIEMLAPTVHPVAIRNGTESALFCQALMLPPVEALHQPATLLVPPDVAHPGMSIDLLDGELPTRRVRVLKVLQRTSSFAQVVFADEAR